MHHMIAITIILILVILILIFFFGKGSDQPNVYENFDNLERKSVVIFKTHLWSDGLENFAMKLFKETNSSNTDFYILMHSNDHSLKNKIKNNELKNHVMVYSENDIKKVYKKGFFSMWLSNHWIMMWFYKHYKQFPYQYIWSIEYDVRISGDSTKLWLYSGDEDFLYPIEPFKDPNWKFRNHYVGGKLKDDEKYYGYLQLARYSKKFLEYLDQCYQSGENGQDELITFSLFKRGNFRGSKELLNKLIKKSWSVDYKDSDRHKKLYTESESNSNKNKETIIFHPIK